MSLDTGLGLTILVLLGSLLVFGPKLKRGSRGVVLVAVLLSLQAFVQPPMEDLLAQRVDEASEDRESGEPDDAAEPEEQIRRQAAQIRRGEEVERLRLRLRRR